MKAILVDTDGTVVETIKLMRGDEVESGMRMKIVRAFEEFGEVWGELDADGNVQYEI